mmetsp:Transcript_106802/g.278890  ORF Transcript_106802/g.278890 Transcript_106802/m.278890 type:complete len:1007 (-) Transcript_106802:87-3107(-)
MSASNTLLASLMADDRTGAMKASANPTWDERVGLTSERAEGLLEEWGPNEIPTPETPLLKIILKQFTGTMPLMLELSCLLSAVAQDWPDFGVIAAMLIVNAALGFREEMKAKRALDDLTKSMESTVTCLRDGAPTVLGVTRLVPGDVIHLRGGSMTPADVEWLEGDVLSVDTAALTGEPIPRKYPSDEYGKMILSGTTIKSGESYCIVRQTGVRTEIGQGQADILADRAQASVSVFEQRIMVVVNVIIALAVLDAICLVLVQGFARDGFRPDERNKTLLTALSVLIAAVPVALPLVLQVTMAIGAYRMATRHNAIVTRMSALQDIASMDVLCSDKTGTLTTAMMSINLDLIWPASDAGFQVLGSLSDHPGFSKTSERRTQQALLLMALLSANKDKRDDAIDGAVLRAFDAMKETWGGELAAAEAAYEQLELTGFNPEVKRTVARVRCRSDGRVIVVAKGLATKVLDTAAGGTDDGALQWRCAELDDPNRPDFGAAVGRRDEELSAMGYKTLAVAIGVEGGDMHFLGLLPMIDPPRADTATTVGRLLDAGVEVKMITGDHLNIAKETARLVGMDTNILPGETTRDGSRTHDELIRSAGGFAQVLPRDKRECVLSLQRSYGLVVGMTGDGVNDAPALSAAQCGIAVDDATDAAKAAASMILTAEGLSAVFGAVVESRKIFARLFSYVSYRLAATIQILLFLSVLVYAFDCSLSPLYVILLALFNDITMIPVAEDRQVASAEPQHASVANLVGFSATLGLAQSLASMTFYLMMDKGLVQGLGSEAGYPRGVHAQNAIWLQVSIAAELLIFAARAPGLFFFSRPSTELLLSTMLGNAVCTVLAVCAFAEPLGWQEASTIWAFDVAALFAVDITKMLYKQAFEHNVAGIIDEAALAAEDVGAQPAAEPGDVEAQPAAALRERHASVRSSLAEFAMTGAKRHRSAVLERGGGGGLPPVPPCARARRSARFERLRGASRAKSVSGAVSAWQGMRRQASQINRDQVRSLHPTVR